MGLKHSRKGAFTIFEFMLLITGLICVLVLYFVARKMGIGASSLFVCDGDCHPACPDGTRHDLKGDAYCREQFDDTKGGGPKCCLSLDTGEGSTANPSDIKLIYTTKSKDPLPNGGRVALVPTYRGSDYSVEGTFSLAFTGDVKGKQCYWRVGEEDWQEDVLTSKQTAPKGDTMFTTLFEEYIHHKKNPQYSSRPSGNAEVPDSTQPCADLAGRSTITVPFKNDNNYNYIDLFGTRMKYTLVVVDPESCPADVDVDLCTNTYSFTVYIDIPDRHPSITLKLNGQQAGTKEPLMLESGKTNKFELVINEPYGTCDVTYNSTINLNEAFDLTFESKEPGRVFDRDKNCFRSSYTKSFTVSIPETFAKAIPFEITVNTSSGDRGFVITYPFQIAPEDRVRVNGPSPGFSKEKFVDISCHDVSCNGFSAAYTAFPLSCANRPSIPSADWHDLKEELIPYGGTNSAMWRFGIDAETNNGDYLCIKADTDEGDIYSLGLHQNLPSKVAIDSEPPELSVTYDPLLGMVKMYCTDEGEWASGCAPKPYSYAYVVNPLQFATSVLTLGTLSADWSGCPNAETGYYVTWNGEGGEMPFLEQDVRVMCVRATDNAGNHVVKSRLVYGSAEVLGAFLVAAARTQ